MQTPPEIVLRQVPDPDAVRARVQEKITALERFYDRITSCHVMVEPSQRRHQQGNQYHVRVHLCLPGDEVVVTRDPPDKHAHEDLEVALRDAFQATRRRLEDFIRIRRQKIKTHEAPPHGTVARLFPEADYGFLVSAEGDEVYFHRNSVADDGFDRLQVGTRVRFGAEPGDKGLQATAVQPTRGRD